MKDATATIDLSRPIESSIEPSNEDATDGRLNNVRLRGRLLMVTPVVWPVPIAGAFVVKGLLSQLAPDEVVVAAERWPENTPNQTHEGNGHRVHFVMDKWKWPKRGARFFMWLRWFAVPRMARKLIKLAKAERCDVILATFPEEQSFCAAYLASRRLRVKFFPFFHNTYRENRRGISYWIASWLQARAFQAADVIFVMSEGIQNEWQRLYPRHRFEPLVHTTNAKIPSFARLPQVDRNQVRLGYLGSINEANLDALRRIRDVVNSAENLDWNIYTGAPEWFLQKEGLTGPRIRREQPADDVLLQKLAENDILVLPHGLTGGWADIEYRTIFPTRTIPYLLSGRPILAHSPPHSFLTSWLKRHDCAELVEHPDAQLLRAAIDRLAADRERREQLVRNALQAAELFRADRVVANMKRTINQCLA